MQKIPLKYVKLLAVTADS